MSNLPRKFIQEDFDNYPESVQNYINERGYDKKYFDEFKKNNRYIQIDTKSSLFANIVGLFFVGLFLLILVLGVASIGEWLMGISIFYESNECIKVGGMWDNNVSRCNISY
jgi:hypothetical protein